MEIDNIDNENTNKNTDWNAVWRQSVEKLHKKGTSKSWNKIAKKFDKWMDKDDYPEEMVSKIKVEEGDTVLDIGCGNGAITIPIAKKTKSVTALDLSPKMMDILRENVQAEKLSNIKFINKGLEEVGAHELGPHDVVVASRSMNGIPDIKPELEKINEIAQKRVYLTLWGTGGREFEGEIAELLGRKTNQHPEYTIVLNILKELGIHAHFEPMECNTRNFYSSMDEALERIEWRVGELNQEERDMVKEHLSHVLTENEDGSFSYMRNSSKWILVWWEK